MTTTEIKKSIIDRISQIEDLNFLKAIKTIKVKEKIQHSRKHARQGNIISNENLNKEIEDWLRKEK